MHLIKKPFLFCSSYSPLIIILLILKINFNNISCVEKIIITISIVSIAVGYILLYYSLTNSSTGSKPYMIRDVENKNDLMHTYLLPYIIFIVSFAGLDSLNRAQIFVIIILFILLCVIYIRSDLFLFDVVLVLLGYNYYKISTDYNVFIAITKDNLYEYKNKELGFRLVDKNFLKSVI